MRHTKIIATVGPASNTEEMLDALIGAGTDIFRLNFSHGTHETHRATFERIRAAAQRARRQVAVLQDLSGPKIRTGLLEGHQPIFVKAGERLRIVTGDRVGGPGVVSTAFEPLARSVRPGDRLLLADGTVELCVDTTDGREIATTVIDGGVLGERKGINAPGVPLATSAITAKDIADLDFGLALGVDMVAVSFVQSAADLEHARRVMGPSGADVPLVAKLERPQAVEQIDGILQACDAVMVARGDLGLEMPFERLPRAQKEITRRARLQAIPVIVATQVLESMTVEARPTRAEVNDAANAVADGVDAIMLAGETAAGAHPARAVQTLDAIICDAEAAPVYEERTIFRHPLHKDHAQALCEAAVTLANRGDAQAIIAVTRAGGTARRLSALRPRAPIFAITSRDDTARRLSIYWGVMPFCMEISEDLESAGTLLAEQLVAGGFIAPGAAVVVVNISPDLARPDANYLKIRRL
jgi:pyruvate kinase